MRQRQGTAGAVAAAVLLSGLLLHLVAVSERYPYYLIWDMDLTVAIDTLIVNSGRLPDHISHPSFGVYLVTAPSARLSRALGGVSVADLRDAANTLNPMAAMAELTDYLRRHSPLACAAVALILWLSLSAIFRLPCWAGALSFAVIGSEEALTYHASMVRSELYSVLFWSLAVLALALAARTRRPFQLTAGTVLAGLLMGLSFLTKIQSLFDLAAAALLGLLFSSLARSPREPEAITRLQARRLAWLAAVNAAVFAFLCVASYRAPMPEGSATFADGYGVTALSVVALFATVALAAVQTASLRGASVRTTLGLPSFLTLLVSGFLLSFALHFAGPRSPVASWQYLRCDFKVLFFRNAFYGISARAAIANVRSWLGHDPLLFAVHLLLLGGLLLGGARGWVRIGVRERTLCAVASALAFVNLALGTRFVLRDTLWVDVIFTFLGVLYFALLLSRAERFRAGFAWAGSGALAVLMTVNAVHSWSMLDRIDANYNQYGWQDERWAEEVYHGNQRLYTELMKARFAAGASLRPALRQAREHKTVREDAEFVFTNLRPTLREVGLAWEGMPVWLRDPGFRIAGLPDSLHGASVVDASALPLQRGPFLVESQVRVHSEELDKFRPEPRPGAISVLTRSDLHIFLFVDPSDAAKLRGEMVAPTADRIRLAKGSQTLELVGLEILNYLEVPVVELRRGYFFVVASRSR
jgi:hypothetical protein